MSGSTTCSRRCKPTPATAAARRSRRKGTTMNRKETTMNKTTITAEPGMPQITITREFDAPRELAFRAYTDPQLLVQWLGPRDLTLTIDRYEVRDGGTWRYVYTDAQGIEYGLHGVFHGTPSPDAIVQTFEFEGMPGRGRPGAAPPRGARGGA